MRHPQCVQQGARRVRCTARLGAPAAGGPGRGASAGTAPEAELDGWGGVVGSGVFPAQQPPYDALLLKVQAIYLHGWQGPPRSEPGIRPAPHGHRPSLHLPTPTPLLAGTSRAAAHRQQAAHLAAAEQRLPLVGLADVAVCLRVPQAARCAARVLAAPLGQLHRHDELVAWEAQGGDRVAHLGRQALH